MNLASRHGRRGRHRARRTLTFAALPNLAEQAAMYVAAAAAGCLLAAFAAVGG